MATVMHPKHGMRRSRSGIVAIAVLGVHAVTAVGAAAQQRPAEPTTWASREGVFESRELIGMRIKNAEGKSLGLSAFLGVGERKVVVPWSQLNIARVSDGGAGAAETEVSPRRGEPT